MRQALKFAIALVVFAAVCWAIHRWVLTVYAVGSNPPPALRSGDRVMANRLSHNHHFRCGELMVFRSTLKASSSQSRVKTATGRFVGRVTAVAGDTLRLRGGLYRVPLICCRRCACRDCRLYAVATGRDTVLVHQHQVVGRVVWTYHLPF